LKEKGFTAKDTKTCMEYYCEVEQESGRYIVRFPDMPNVKTFCDTREEALFMAKDALNAVLESEIDHGFPVRAPNYKSGHPIPVSKNILLSIQPRLLRGELNRPRKNPGDDLSVISAFGKSAQG
jgi:predicted RNase H-like HicB family nuclease